MVAMPMSGENQEPGVGEPHLEARVAEQVARRRRTTFIAAAPRGPSAVRGRAAAATRPARRRPRWTRVGCDADRRRRAAAPAHVATPSRPHTSSALVHASASVAEGATITATASSASGSPVRGSTMWATCRVALPSIPKMADTDAPRVAQPEPADRGGRDRCRAPRAASATSPAGAAERVEAALAEAHQRARDAGGAQARRARVHREALGDAVEVEARAGRQRDAVSAGSGPRRARRRRAPRRSRRRPVGSGRRQSAVSGPTVDVERAVGGVGQRERAPDERRHVRAHRPIARRPPRSAATSSLVAIQREKTSSSRRELPGSTPSNRRTPRRRRPRLIRRYVPMT